MATKRKRARPPRRLKIRRGMEPETVLATWRTFMKALPAMNEKEVVQALTKEKESDEPRLDILRRLHNRRTKLRYMRELWELLS